MANLNRIVYLSEQQYANLIANGTLTVGNQTIIYNDNDLYFTPHSDTTPTITDEKVLNTLSTSTKYYITGTNNAETSTGTQIFDSGVYVTATGGQLSAQRYSFNANGVQKASIIYNSAINSLDFVFN